VPVDDDLSADVEFDLIDEPDEPDEPEDTLNDVFARDTAIPAASPEHLAAEAMRKMDARDRANPPTKSRENRPRMPPPPPMRGKQRAPVTVEPPSDDLEFDSFDAPIDVFGHRLPGTQSSNSPKYPHFDGSDLPTAPPGAVKGLVDQSRRTNPAPPRAGRPAFLVETTRNRPLDAELLARATLPGATNKAWQVLHDSEAVRDSALDFVDSHDPLLDSLAPMAGLEAPEPPSSTPRAGPQEMHECYAVGDFSRALQIAEELLARSPDDISARRCAQNCRDVLTQMFAARIGPLDQVITVVVGPEEIQWLSLDHRAGFLLSLVDGQSTVDEILDISGMTRLDALKIIHDLAERQVVRLA
jgi:hypothetical protein